MSHADPLNQVLQAEQAQHNQQALQALLAQVAQQPGAHDFFMLLRRLDALRPGLPRTGHSLRPRDDALRLAQAPALDFAPAALAHLERRPGAAPRLAVHFFGLLGPQAPLPLHLTDHVRERLEQHKDSTPAHFLDLFHHRMLSLLYRAWAQAQPVVHQDRPADDRYLAWLAAVAGQAPQADGLPGPALAHQAGLLAGRSRHAEALCKVLTQYFGVPAAVQPNVGHWLTLAPQDRTRLGHAANRPQRHQQALARLGDPQRQPHRPPHLQRPAEQAGPGAVVGSRVWDHQSRFRLLLGPLTRAQHDSFLPGGAAWPALVEWVRRLAGDQLQWELQLELPPLQRPAPRLDGALRLGVAAWLGGTPPPGRPARPLRIRPATCFLLRRAAASGSSASTNEGTSASGPTAT